MDEWQGRKREPVTEERLVRAVSVLEDIMREHGAGIGPLYDTVRQELAEFRQRLAEHGPQAAPAADASRKVA